MPVHSHEAGSALFYILIAVALLGALTYTLSRPSGEQLTTQQSHKIVTEVQSQVDFIHSAINECVLRYPKDDNGAIAAGKQKNARYPLMPNDSYYDDESVTPGSAANNQLKNIRCPGNPGNDPDHVEIFSARSGKFMPPPPPNFDEWQYYNGDDGVFYYISTSSIDSSLQGALAKLDDQFQECETDIIDARSGLVDIASESAGVQDISCANGKTCLRVWLITKGTAVYQAGSDEHTANCP